jgi:hypothetical protein
MAALTAAVRGAVVGSTDLINPRLSEIDWEVVAARLLAATPDNDQSRICPDCGEREDEMDLHQTCCPHEEVDLALGFGGDPGSEDPRRGTCVRCHASLHLEWDENPAADGYWEID